MFTVIQHQFGGNKLKVCWVSDIVLPNFHLLQQTFTFHIISPFFWDFTLSSVDIAMKLLYYTKIECSVSVLSLSLFLQSRPSEEFINGFCLHFKNLWCGCGRDTPLLGVRKIYLSNHYKNNSCLHHVGHRPAAVTSFQIHWVIVCILTRSQEIRKHVQSLRSAGLEDETDNEILLVSLKLLLINYTNQPIHRGKG